MATPVKRTALHENADEVRTAGVTHLSKDLSTTVNDPETSDVIFICKKGEKVHACRWLLSVRCRVFQGMFGHEMRECKLVEVPLLHFSSEVMLVVFEYLYTGAIKSHLPQDWRIGFEIISAARFFMIHAIEVIAEEFLWDEVAKIDGNSPRELIVDMLNEAFEFQEAWEGVDLVLEKLAGSLGVHWFQEEWAERLSDASVDYILSRRKRGTDEEKKQQSLEEYVTFRGILLWAARQTLPKSITELQKALPIEKDEAALWSTIFKFPLTLDDCTGESEAGATELHNPVAVLNSRFGTDVRKESLQRFLAHVDWFRIRAMLLLKVVKPLDLIPQHALLKALALQALHKPVDRLKPTAYECKCAGSLTWASDGHLTCKSEDGERNAWGRAVVLLPMPRSYGTYEWQLEILENDTKFIGLGLICGSDNDPWKEHGLQQLSLHSCPAARLLCINYKEGKTYVSDKDTKWEKLLVEPEKGSLIKFILNTSKSTCHVSFGDSFATMWRDLPSAVYYPVVAVAYSKRAIIRIKTVSGFYYV